MDLVAITDHDSIGGALELLDRNPSASDVIVGEEVSTRFPDHDIQVHLGVYGMTEALHAEIQPLRPNVFEVIARLREANVFFALNHLLHFYRGQMPFDDYLRLIDEVPALEVRNGTMVPAHNALVERIARGGWRPGRPTPLGMTAGSDAHTLRRIGVTWTSAPGSTREEFLSSLRAGLGEPGGRHGGAAAVSGDAYGVIGSYIASLAGLGPRDHSPMRRVALLAFAALSLPFEFMPVVLATTGKSSERREGKRALTHLAAAGNTAPAGWVLEPDA